MRPWPPNVDVLCGGRRIKGQKLRRVSVGLIRGLSSASCVGRRQGSHDPAAPAKPPDGTKLAVRSLHRNLSPRNWIQLISAE